MARILVVDDERDITDLIERSLRREGHQVIIAYNGPGALQVARRQRPDLVLLDILMPQMNGIQVCKQMRTDPALATMPILFLTAKGMIEDKVEGFRAGADDYLTKPFDLLELKLRVGALLRRSRMRPLEAEEKGESLYSLEIHAFGQAQVLCGSHLVTASEWESATTKELFFYFLAHPRGLRKEQVMDTFWGEVPPARSHSIFHSTLYRLRRALFHECLLYEDGLYRLNPDIECWFDVEEFENLLDRAEGLREGSEERAECYRQAIALYQGDYLEEFYSDWCYLRREELRGKYIEALIRLADLYAGQGGYEEAIELYKKALVQDDYREDVHRRVMRCYALAGNRGAAIRHYQLLARFLEEDLGLGPMPETVALYQGIRHGDLWREYGEALQTQGDRSGVGAQ